MLRVFVRYGSGAQWIRGRHSHFSPPIPLWKLLLFIGSASVRIPLAAIRGRDEEVLVRSLDLAVMLCFEIGRFVPNERHVSLRNRLIYARSRIGERLFPAAPEQR